MYPLLTFISGGGISTFISLRYARKTNKVDFADKAMKFMEEQNDKMIRRVEKLEIRLDELEEISCTREGCNIRIKAV
jgi:hypothetical protein